MSLALGTIQKNYFLSKSNQTHTHTYTKTTYYHTISLSLPPASFSPVSSYMGLWVVIIPHISNLWLLLNSEHFFGLIIFLKNTHLINPASLQLLSNLMLSNRNTNQITNGSYVCNLNFLVATSKNVKTKEVEIIFIIASLYLTQYIPNMIIST